MRTIFVTGRRSKASPLRRRRPVSPSCLSPPAYIYRADDMQARSKQQPQQAAEIQMSMLSSYTTLVGLAPPLPGKLFSRSAAQPPAAATVSLPGVPAIISRPQQQSSRAPRFRCSAYNIRHNALVELKRIHPETDGDKWTISEDKDYITLKFNVGKETKKDMLDVTTAEYQEMLIIKGKPDSDIGKELNAHLQMPPGCAAEKVTAKLSDGWLEVKIAKPTNEKTSIPIDQN